MYIHKETFDFLESLKANNHRDWFNENKASYQAALENIHSFVDGCIQEISEFDPLLPSTLSAKSTMFRIFRDARFSKDKTPYKTWFGAALGPEGRKTPGPAYYMHFAPGKSFLAVGYWRPEKDHLEAIRQEIDFNHEEFERILDNLQSNEWQALDSEDKLKRAPKNYTEDHPGIEYIKNRSFTISCPIQDEICYSPDFLKFVVAKFNEAQDFKFFIHQALGGKTNFAHTYRGDLI